MPNGLEFMKAGAIALRNEVIQVNIFIFKYQNSRMDVFKEFGELQGSFEVQFRKFQSQKIIKLNVFRFISNVICNLLKN